MLQKYVYNKNSSYSSEQFLECRATPENVACNLQVQSICIYNQLRCQEQKVVKQSGI